MIRELLACYLVLLNQLERGLLSDQEHFDCLANIVTIFCKIIKQCPMLFSRISQELLEVTSNPEGEYAFMRMLPFEVDYENLLLERTADEHGFEINQLLILLVRSLFVISNVGPQAS